VSVSLFCTNSLLTHSRLNPPLPVDKDGNWYRGESDASDDAADDGLTDEERQILADLN
jgi:hypothetical protein